MINTKFLLIEKVKSKFNVLEIEGNSTKFRFSEDDLETAIKKAQRLRKFDVYENLEFKLT